ncbi:hypothetical protein [Streptomyces mirabilis]|uniref:hypothetical protein n=1 Tax=Streptomyces mirabilis TaxID=68239 RepID=UPI0036C0C0A0
MLKEVLRFLLAEQGVVVTDAQVSAQGSPPNGRVGEGSDDVDAEGIDAGVRRLFGPLGLVCEGVQELACRFWRRADASWPRGLVAGA